MDKELGEAIALLLDRNLVWSDDFETIRIPLANLLERHRFTPTHFFDEELGPLLQALSGEIVPDKPDHLQAWSQAARKDLEIIQEATDRSKYLAQAIARLFQLL